MITLTWCIFIPLLTGAVVVCIPSRQKQLIRFVALAGAAITLVIATGLVLAYRAEDGQTTRSHLLEVQARMVDAVDKGVDYPPGPEGVERWRKDFLTPLVSDSGRVTLEPPEAWESWSPELRDLWGRAAELALAAEAPQSRHLTFTEFVPWIPQFRVHYFLGVDGLSLPLIWLTALLCLLSIVYSWTIERGVKGYFALFLLLETGMIGVFSALDFFLFYVFWEVVLLPMYFLIGIWGGENRLYAAIKFFIYTLAGSVLMLAVMLVMYFVAEPHTFNLLALMKVVPGFDPTLGFWLFLLLFIAFAIKLPVFPFHTWLPDAHVEAPTAVSVILAGILLKMGGYGLFRFSYPMLPDQATSDFFVGLLAGLGMINIVYGAFCALAQKDFKKLVAYSSVSHMGYVLLGLAALTHAGVMGGVMQMFNHGVSSAMLFLIVGVVYERAHHRDLNGFGGLGLQMPWYTGIATVGLFASLGLPGLNGFIGETLCFLGAFDSDPVTGSLVTTARGIAAPWIVYVSLLGLVLAAVYILWTIQRVFLGTVRREEYRTFRDLSFREVICLSPLAFLCILLGVLPGILIHFMDGSLVTITESVRAVLGN